MKKFKIIVDIERMKYPFTGLHNYCENLYKNLLEYGNGIFDLYFFTHSSVKLPESINRMDRRQWDKLYLYKSKKYKLWHVTYQDSKFVPNGNMKLVYTIHDLNFLYTNKSTYKKQVFLNRIQNTINKADHITVISNFVLKDIKKNLDISNKQISVIHNGVTVTKYPNFNNPKYLPKKKFIFTLGTVLYKKHFHVLPQLIEGTEYELVIAGIHSNPSYIVQIEDEIKKHKVQAQVSLIGTINDEEKYWYLKNCAAFVFPSISEGFGIPPIEAMIMGKPVFLSTYTSLPEIGGDLAYYFDSFDKKSMQDVFKKGMSDYIINNKKEAIITWGKQFSWDKAVKAYIDVYEKVLNPLIDNIGTHNTTLLKRNNKLSVLIITHNEEDNIIDLINNISFADEIVIIDSNSTDNTIDLISQFSNVKVIQHKFVNFSKQRNFALQQVENDWVLFIDADERISNHLKKEIIQILDNPKDSIAFHVKRDNFIGDTYIQYSGWQNDYMTPLFNKNNVTYNEDKWVHETLTINGKSTFLNNHLFHYTYKNYSDYKRKMQLYAELKAKELFTKKMRPNFYHLQIKPIYRFFYHYIFKLGFLDGKNGNMIAKINALGIKNRYLELKRLYNK